MSDEKAVGQCPRWTLLRHSSHFVTPPSVCCHNTTTTKRAGETNIWLPELQEMMDSSTVLM